MLSDPITGNRMFHQQRVRTLDREQIVVPGGRERGCSLEQTYIERLRWSGEAFEVVQRPGFHGAFCERRGLAGVPRSIRQRCDPG